MNLYFISQRRGYFILLAHQQCNFDLTHLYFISNVIRASTYSEPDTDDYDDKMNIPSWL